MEKKPEIIEYKKCPVCGSEETLIASLAVVEEAKGINSAAIPRYYHIQRFVMRNPGYVPIIGSKAIAGNIYLDICTGKNCGIIRAVKVEIGEAMALDMPKRG